MAIAWVLIGLLSDLIFNAAAATSRAYEAKVDRYFERRGFSPRRKTPALRAR